MNTSVSKIFKKSVYAKWFTPFFVAFFVRIIFSWYTRGFHQMDEHWQVFEPANYLVNHVWMQTTEWKEGLRNWIYPALISCTLWCGELLGLKSPFHLVSFSRMILGIFSCLAVPLVYLGTLKISNILKLKTPTFVSIIAAFFTALWPYSIFCGYHAHGEMPGALFILIASAIPLLIETETSILASGFFFGAAAAIKIDLAVAGLGYGISIFIFSIVGKQNLRKKIMVALKRSALFSGGVLPFILLIGYTDYAAWGQWFHSVLGHAKVNIVDEIGNQWGVSPWYFHLLYFVDIGSVFALLGLVGFVLYWKKLSQPVKQIWVMQIFFIAVFSYMEHKEKRFMAPLLYTAQLTCIPLAFLLFERVQKKWKQPLSYFFITILFVHGALNVYFYLIKRPWYDRVLAIYNAGQIPGIQKMISPSWNAVFYFPRNTPTSMAFEKDTEELDYVQRIRREVRDLNSFGLAVDWDGMWIVEDIGFKCKPVPEGKPKGKEVPWAYHCLRAYL